MGRGERTLPAVSSRPSTLQQLFAEMKRRRVFKVMAVYGAVAFVILQVADIAFEPLGLPPWAMTLVLVLAMIGFPIAIMLAWAFESTPEGVKRTASASDEELRELVAEPRSRRWPSGLLALASMVLLFGTGWYMGGGGRGDERAMNLVSEAQASDLRALAALPLENVNGSDENRLIATGIHGDLLTRLSRIGALRVTSRTSVREYEETEKTLRDIADELGVDYVLEGSVQSSGGQVRVIMSLVEADADETLLWSEQFDHEVTPENLFEIQAEIAQAVVRELEARLTPEEEATLAAMQPASSSVAIQWYYRGLDAWMRGNDAAGDARDAFRRAVEIDSTYASAWAWLAKLESRLVWLGEGSEPAARAAMERTEALAPGSVEAFIARGYYEYYGRLNYDAALSAFRAAERQAPSDAEAVVAVGLILRRLGNWEESARALRRATRLDPRNAESTYTLGEDLWFMGAFEAADAAVDRTLSLDPDNPIVRSYKVVNLVNVDGDTGRARRLARELGLDPSNAYELAALAHLTMLDRDYEEAIEVMARPDAIGRGLTGVESRLDAATVRRLAAGGSTPAVEALADSVLAILDELDSADLAFGVNRAEALALAGRSGEALPLLQEADRVIRSRIDHVDHTSYAVRTIQAYGWIGETERGLDLLEDTIDRPAARLTSTTLRLDPRYDPFRDDPRFEELVRRREQFEAEGAAWAEANGPWLP